MTAVPPEALDAALGSVSQLADQHIWVTAAEGSAGGMLMRRELLRRALNAAAPAIAAAERERIRQLAIEHGAQYDIDVVGGLPFTDLIREEETDVAQ